MAQAEGASYPVLHQIPGASAEGLLLKAEPSDRLRLDHYESAFVYRPRGIGQGPADDPFLAYLPDTPELVSTRPWSLADWSSRHGPLAIDAAHEIMSYLGTHWSGQLAKMRRMIEARAWSRHLARTRPSCEVLPAREVQLEGHTQKHAGFFRFDEYQLRHGRFDGTLSSLLTREVFVGSDAALVLPYDPVRDEVVLIEQFRMGPLTRSDPAPWVYEPVAGLVDPGESPAETAKREALEEAGLTIDRLEPIADTYASPGATTDFFHCYLGICSLETAENWLGGEEAEGEDIRSHQLSFDEAIALVDTGRINVAPLAMMLLWLARNRDRLRAA